MTTAFSSSDQRENFQVPEVVTRPIPIIPMWFDKYGLSVFEWRVYGHIVTIAGEYGKCWESVTNIAKACIISRNVTLKALHRLTEVHKLLIRNKRVGETDEYSIAPESEWASPIPPEERLLSRRKRKKVDNPSLQGMGSDTLNPSLQGTGTDSPEEQLPVRPSDTVDNPSLQGMGSDTLNPSLPGTGTDSPEEQLPVRPSDTKVIHIKEYQEKQQQDEFVVAPEVEKPSIWRRNPEATRYCQIPPIYDQAVGVEIQRQMELEGLTAQKVVSRAIAFSKVPLLVLELLSGVGAALVNACEKLLNHKEKQNGIPDEVFDRLKNADIHLRHDTAAKLWQDYGSEFEVAIAYVSSKKDINDKAAYFRKCLELGWVKNTKPETKKHDPYKLTPEQEQWHKWAQDCGLCDRRPLNYALVDGEVAIIIFEPEFNSFSPPIPLSRAMRKYPMV